MRPTQEGKMTDSTWINGPLPPQQLIAHPALLEEGYQICARQTPVLKATGQDPHLCYN